MSESLSLVSDYMTLIADYTKVTMAYMEYGEKLPDNVKEVLDGLKAKKSELSEIEKFLKDIPVKDASE